jgi:hypothetical protein
MGGGGCFENLSRTYVPKSIRRAPPGKILNALQLDICTVFTLETGLPCIVLKKIYIILLVFCTRERKLKKKLGQDQIFRKLNTRIYAHSDLKIMKSACIVVSICMHYNKQHRYLQRH